MVKVNSARTSVLSAPSASPFALGAARADAAVPPAAAAVQSAASAAMILTSSPVLPVTRPLAVSDAPPRVRVVVAPVLGSAEVEKTCGETASTSNVADPTAAHCASAAAAAL